MRAVALSQRLRRNQLTDFAVAHVGAETPAPTNPPTGGRIAMSTILLGMVGVTALLLIASPNDD